MDIVEGPTGNTFYKFSKTTKSELSEFCDIALDTIQDAKLFASIEDIADKIVVFGQLSLGQFRILNTAAKKARLTLPDEVAEFLLEQGERVAVKGKIVPSRSKPSISREDFVAVMGEVAGCVWETYIGKA